MSYRAAAPRPVLGFTLIELMITVVVVSVLAAVAYPSFMGQVRKSRRADAITALHQVSQAQERWRANNPTYSANLSSSGLNVSNPGSGYYTLQVTGNTATGYTATATAVGAQASDTRCLTLSLVASAGNFTYTSTPNEAVNRCWNR